MYKRLTLVLAGSALAMLSMAGCGSTGSSYGGAAKPGASTSAAPAATGKDVAAASTTLGTIVVNGKGMTVYVFDKDVANSGKSNCTGQCATLWHAVTSSGATPSMDGVTGKVGTMTAADGSNQVTIGGRPVYTYSGDNAAGDVNGEGVGKLWYVLNPAGDEIKTGRGSY